MGKGDDSEPTLLQIIGRHEISRRDALKLLGAGVAAVQAGCLERPGEEIAPSVLRPEIAPGVPAYYATSAVDDGFAVGLLVEANGGRPTKIEGNPDHPASRGGTTAQHQAAVLDLYDPHRARGLTAHGMPATADRLRAELGIANAGPLWLVLPPHSSPTLAALLERVRERHPDMHVVWHEPIDHRNAYRGAALAFGAPLEQQVAFDRADVVIALDADPLGAMPMTCRWSRDFATRHRPARPTDDPGRLYVAEPMLTPTGTLADARLPLAAGDVLALVTVLVMELRGKLPVPELPQGLVELATRRLAQVGEPAGAWIRTAARDLVAHRGRAAILVGDRQPPVVHAIARILQAAGDEGASITAVYYTEPVRIAPMGDAELSDLADAARAGQVGTLLVSERNPVLDAPPALALGDAIDRVGRSFHHTAFADETSARCAWTIAASHWLERWGDARAWDGTTSFVQPLVEPLHHSLGLVEILAALAGVRGDDRSLVRALWHDAGLSADRAWKRALADGFLGGTAASPAAARVKDPAPIIAALAVAMVPVEPATATVDHLEIDLAPSPAIGDGRFANNAWLQELPRPVTKETWGNAAHLAPATASALGVHDGDEIAITRDGRTIDVPVVIVPEHAAGVISLDLGYGRRTPSQPFCDGLGGDGYALRGPRGESIVVAHVRATGRTHALARTQEHFDLHDRAYAPTFDLAAWRRDPDATSDARGPLPTLLGEPNRDGLQWAMTIDTTICSGCSACVIACQAENNIPVVGAEHVRHSREMHWLRIDSYRTDQGVVNQPMLCQHCEHAPCEYVCPVGATVHSPDGLNEMVYNRCVGTRFCSNNCPYKVRRFNWFAFDEPVTTAALQHNPDVTVRSRGVMEKCTYCVQRIRGAEIQARVGGRTIRPGEVVTACQQACPMGAIQFGALAHTETPMVRWRNESRAYEVLHDLGTRPRTQYLARVRNPPEDT